MKFNGIVSVLCGTSLALCFTASPLLAATSGVFTYTDDGPSISITGHPYGIDPVDDLGGMDIPATITGKPVTKIGYYAFAHLTRLMRVTIPGSVTSIGESAFSGNEGLKNVVIPNGVTSIGASAFSACVNLTSVTIPGSVASIGDYAFWDCGSLVGYTVDTLNSTYSSKDGVLFNRSQSNLIACPGRKPGSYTVPGSVSSISSQAFFGCFSLTSVTIPSSVTSIGGGSFFGCDSLTAINVDAPNADYSSQDGVLFNKSLTSLITFPEGKVGSYLIPDGVVGIANFAFGWCVGLTNVRIGNGVKDVGNSAFYGCSGLTSVTVPAGVTYIDNQAFSACSMLTSAAFLGNAPIMGVGVFEYAASGFTVKYFKTKAGFTSPTWLGYPAVGVDPAPEIVVEQPVGSSLVDGTAKKSFGTVKVGKTGAAKTFTIKNTGTANLTGLAIIRDGAQKTDFIVSGPAKNALAPGSSTNFKVTFKPTAKGDRRAAIHIKNNDANETPFDIKLAGMAK